MSGRGAAPVAGLVLAAGAGTRFGGPKALAPYAGGTLLTRAVAALLAAGCEPVLAVVGAAADRAAAAASAAGARPVVNADWAAGLGSSLRVGLAAVPPGCAAVAVLLVDQPRLGAEPLRRLVEAHRAGATVARATYAGRPGHPVLFDRAVLAELSAAVTGDAGARDWLRAHPELVTDVPCDGLGDPADADTPDELRALADPAEGG